MEINIRSDDAIFVEQQLKQEFEQVKISIEKLSESDIEGANFYNRILRDLHTLFFEKKTNTKSEVLLADYKKKLEVLYRKNSGNYMQLVVLNSNITDFNSGLETTFAEAEIFALAYFYFEAEKINNFLFGDSVSDFFEVE